MTKKFKSGTSEIAFRHTPLDQKSLVFPTVEIIKINFYNEDDNKNSLSNILYSIFNYLTELKQDYSVANFGIYTAKVIESLRNIKEPTISFSLIVRWVAFQNTYIPITHSARKKGKSNYNWHKLIKLVLSVIVAYFIKPLFLTFRIGFFISFISFVIGLYYLALFCIKGIPIQGFTSIIIISIWFLGGVENFFLRGV
jgi:hypothetical protein